MRGEVNGVDRKALTLTSAVLATTYFVAGKLGLTLAFFNTSATAVWPPAGIALAALLVMGYRVWPGILVGNTLEGLLCAYLVTRFANGRHVFERTLDVFKFAALAAVLGPAVAATIGVTSLCLTGSATWTDFSEIWVTWWLGDAAGVLILGPLLLLCGTRPLNVRHSTRGLEAALVALALVLTGQALFGGFLALSVNRYPVEFLVVPPLVWIAFRFGPRETAAATCLLSAMAVWGTLRGFGPFATDSERRRQCGQPRSSFDAPSTSA